MNNIIAWIKSEPAVVWTTGGAAIVAAIQNTGGLTTDGRNWLTLGVMLGVGLITRGAVTPLKGA